MLDNIRAHSLTVARAAEALLTGMVETGINGAKVPDPALVLAGALLHDIAKTICLKTQCDHARKGRDICLELGYPAIGEIVREHVVLKDFSTDRYGRGIFFAKEIVYYADKRVRHDTIVSLNERMTDIIERYGKNDQQRHHLIEENFQRCRTLEHHLFLHINFTTDELEEKVSGQSLLRPEGKELLNPFPGKSGHLQK
ncbi:MAG: HDIG domain-containing protein [Desulfoarculaceae bacterium]|nr:HDIG domain-containing protein [Desulfoarculaceae bacterium]